MPTEFKSDKYVAVVTDDGLLTVHNGPKVLRKMSYGPDGSITTHYMTADTAQGSERKLLTTLDKMPVFCACWAGKGQWNLDIDAGFQRWSGVEPQGQLVKALKNCHFDQKQVRKMLALCKKEIWSYCPRHY